MDYGQAFDHLLSFTDPERSGGFTPRPDVAPVRTGARTPMPQASAWGGVFQHYRMGLTMIACSRSGPTDTSATGTPMSCSNRFTYSRA